jgi:CDP-diacylglycerol--glycerol-3-phosphate 3-phosphatidyltransferase
MFRHVPNAITAARLLLAGVFFVMLAVYQYEGRGDPWFLNTAFLIYCVALFSDFLDGYLARKWQVESAFGRIVDPFVDKILVLGSFTFFAGKNFVIQDTIVESGQLVPVVRTITGVAPGVVIILLARELLVTSLRGSSESQGQSFGAAWSGKFKMVVQSVTILVILVYVNYRHWLREHEWDDGARVFRDVCIWTTVVVTLASGILYIRRAIALARQARGGAAGSC